MKAIHVQSKREYKVSEIIWDIVVLENIKGVKRRVPYELFKKQYKLVNGNLQIPSENSMDIQEARDLAREVLSECGSLVDSEVKPKHSKKANTRKRKKRKSKPKEKVNTEDNTQKESRVTLKEICEELNIKPAAARRILRKSNIEKPGGSWTWDNPEEVDRIKSLLK